MAQLGSQTDLVALVVWIEMLPEDSTADLAAVSAELAHPGIQWFHDPNKRTGRSLAAVLGTPDLVAWDVYLFYDRHAVWERQLPAPRDWTHQLVDPQADPARHRSGASLEPELIQLAIELTSQQKTG